MATPYSDIFDLALMDLTSYELDKLNTLSPTNFLTYMTGLLVRAIPSFTNCLQNLSARNDTTQTFTIELTEPEKDILASWVAVQVIKKEVFDIRQIRGMVQNGSDANRYSEANLLKEKMELQDRLIELADKKMTAYGLSNENWSTFYDTIL